jgi:KDO2-lipid IV(A) lauroyltransferase
VSVQHQIEYVMARLGLRLFRLLGPMRASNMAGAVARGIGPLIPVSQVADRNLRIAVPALDAPARRRVIRGVWDNLARTIAEFPHIQHFTEGSAVPGYVFEGAEHVRVLVARGGPVLILTAHLGNWEILPLAFRRLGMSMAFFYRAASNPAVDRLILRLRAQAVGAPVTMFAKGASGARGAYAHLARGGVLTMLTDQKLNDGLEAPFFGLPAMTAPALAVFARKFACPILPVHVERLGAARLRIVCEPPLIMPQTADKAADIQAMTVRMNAIIEGWVRARPGQWLWLHRRWPKTVVA